MTRRRLSGGLFVASGLQLVVQVIVALAWPVAYSPGRNAISDLGVTVCRTFSESGLADRHVCSPLHSLFNGGMIVAGLLVAAGSLALWNGFPRPRLGNAALVLSAVGGLCIALIGVFPWDVDPAAHDASVLASTFLTWTAMVFVVWALPGRSAARRGVRAVTLFLLVLSVAASAVLSVAAVAVTVFGWSGGSFAGLQLGFIERLAVDTLTIWTVFLGACLLVPGDGFVFGRFGEGARLRENGRHGL